MEKIITIIIGVLILGYIIQDIIYIRQRWKNIKKEIARQEQEDMPKPQE